LFETACVIVAPTSREWINVANQTHYIMSYNNSSFFSTEEDTFATRRKQKVYQPPFSKSFNANTTVPGEVTNTNNLTSIGGINANITSGNINVTLPIGEISPQTPIKSLIDSPFRSSRIHSSPITTQSPIPQQSQHSTTNADQLLKSKIRSHQQKYSERFNSSYANMNGPVDNNTFLHSVFGTRSRARSMNGDQGMTNLRNIGLSASDVNLNPLQTPPVTGIKSKSRRINEHEVHGQSPIQELDNPYVSEALRRIVNKETEARKLLFSILYFLVYRFVRSFVRLFVYTHPIIGKSFNTVSANILNFADTMNERNAASIVQYFGKCLTFDSILNTTSYLEYFVNIFTAFVIISASYRLLKPKDKCLDLPLTKAQRKILGLDVKETPAKLKSSDSFNSIIGTQGSHEYEIDEDEEDDELIRRIRNPASPNRLMQPTRVVVPDINNLDGVMGGINSLAIGGGRTRNSQDVGNMTWG
jgi:nucleoporin POM34